MLRSSSDMLPVLAGSTFSDVVELSMMKLLTILPAPALGLVEIIVKGAPCASPVCCLDAGSGNGICSRSMSEADSSLGRVGDF